MERDIDISLLQTINQIQSESDARDRVVYFAAKRVFGFTIALLALILLSPLMLAIALLVAIDSPGPVIFVQNRVGSRRKIRRGRTYWQKVIFRCYKFRTMIHDADPTIHRKYVQALIANDKDEMASIQNCETGVLKLVNDPRVTHMGRFLRKFSLDELPQLWNVVLGDMSLVGPRPAIPYEVQMYNPWHRLRLETHPGLTGLWQVEGRSSADFDEMVRLDIKYIQHQSFWYDVKILLKTPKAVLTTRGAV
jgi:lipopolysaccharide/colanic/teichoic acid biosynthesis glycosyltransferase